MSPRKPKSRRAVVSRSDSRAIGSVSSEPYFIYQGATPALSRTVPDFLPKTDDEVAKKVAARIMTDDQLLVVLAQNGKRDAWGVSLFGVNLSGTQVGSVGLFTPLLTMCDFTAANLKGASIGHHWPTGHLQIQAAVFERADFSDGFLFRLSFDRCNMINAIFRSTLIQGCLFSETHLEASAWQESKLQGDVVFTVCNLSSAMFNGIAPAPGYSAKFHANGSKLEDAQFWDCNLQGAIFSGTMNSGTKFVRCNLRNANFSGSNHRDAVFDHCDLTGAIRP
jgi:uncharacterized protein YjbI with pentapeptide repeats